MLSEPGLLLFQLNRSGPFDLTNKGCWVVVLITYIGKQDVYLKSLSCGAEGVSCSVSKAPSLASQNNKTKQKKQLLFCSLCPFPDFVYSALVLTLPSAFPGAGDSLK